MFYETAVKLAEWCQSFGDVYDLLLKASDEEFSIQGGSDGILVSFSVVYINEYSISSLIIYFLYAINILEKL